MPGPAEVASSETDWSSVAFLDKLKFYYSRLFPSDLFYDWLSYGGDDDLFHKREFSFTLDGDIYIRYLSFKSGEELAKGLASRLPVKIDIGAVFNSVPAEKQFVAAEAFKPVTRELVFDIDLTDYDDVRTCCSAANICEKCWNFMKVAVKVMDDILRVDFGFQNILWVYSGRRGIHAWVCDERARNLSNEGRSAVAEYLHVHRGGDKSSKKTNLWGPVLHPSLQRVFDKFLSTDFERIIVEDQGLFDNEERWQRVLDLIPDESLRGEIDAHLKKKGDTLEPVQRWEYVLEKVMQASSVRPKAGDSRPKGGNPLHEIVFALIYPRLDINVSKQQNHLLKAPFCIHPKTGRVCVPFDPRLADDFNPENVPTLDEMLTEMNAYDKKHGVEASKSVKDYKKTQMKDAIDIFKKTFLRGVQEDIRKQRVAGKRALEVPVEEAF